MTERDDIEAAVPEIDATMREALESASKLLDEEGVVGVGQGATADGAPCITVMVASPRPELDQRIPKRIKGVPVEVRATGPFTAAED